MIGSPEMSASHCASAARVVLRGDAVLFDVAVGKVEGSLVSHAQILPAPGAA
jgi:hypothetical protein